MLFYKSHIYNFKFLQDKGKGKKDGKADKGKKAGKGEKEDPKDNKESEKKEVKEAVKREAVEDIATKSHAGSIIAANDAIELCIDKLFEHLHIQG